MTNEEIYQYHKTFDDEMRERTRLHIEQFTDIEYNAGCTKDMDSYCEAIADSIRSLCGIAREYLERQR